MYGKIVEFKGYNVWINCLPSTKEDELQRRAEVKLERFLNDEIANLD